MIRASPSQSASQVPKSVRIQTCLGSDFIGFLLIHPNKMGFLQPACLNIAISYVNTDYVGHERMIFFFNPRRSRIYFNDKILKGLSEGMGARVEIRHRLRKMVPPPSSMSLHHTYCFFCAWEARSLAFSLAASAVSRAFSVAVSASVLVGVSPAQQVSVA